MESRSNAAETHFTGLDEAHFFIEQAAFVGCVKDEAVESLGAGPRDELFQEKFRDAAAAPFGFGEDVNDDGVAAVGDADLCAGSFDRMRQDAPELHSDAGNSFVPKVGIRWQP